MITVAIADDHAVVRAGLQRLLSGQDDLHVVGTAADGAEAVKLAKDKAPNVILMDLSMPTIDGIAATEEIRKSAPDVCVVALTSFSDRDLILKAVDAGAVGYLLKDADPRDIVAGIRAAAGG